ncbi:S24 family peptidase [Vagococcus carniphilus]|uniref:LexA family transcriptional regulator n=1 Tax=Vagococcus carniphilus TaxID=218144 RepID=UPI002890FCF2|nr:S24 family peptidase [Vagococcus carniphilus]MDT2815995.1 S24 family peptidase [Vagococcus carniphilus]
MDNISHRLKYAMDLRGVTATKLSEGTKISRSSISEWLSGKYMPKQDKIFSIAKYLNVDEAWLLGLDVPIEKKPDIVEIYSKLDDDRQNKVYNFANEQLNQQENKISTLKPIKCIDNSYAAANPTALDYGDSIVTEEYLEEIEVPKGAEFSIKIKGDSMSDLIPDNSRVFYAKQDTIENGEIAIVEIFGTYDGDGITCKKVYFDFDNQKIILHSLNEKYDDRILPAEQVRIIGKVLFN